MEKKQEEVFSFTYSAKEQEEIERIRQKYTLKEDKMERLRRLDRSVTRKGTVYAIVLGVVGSMILGSGMSLVMTDIGAALGLSGVMIPGIAIGVVGLGMALLNYPMYRKILDGRKQKYAEQILKLSDKIMNHK